MAEVCGKTVAWTEVEGRGSVPLRCGMPAGHPEGLCAWSATGIFTQGAAVGHSGGGGAVGHGGYTSSSALHFYDCGIHRRPQEWASDDNRCPICFSAVDHPPHYGGADNLYEVIKVILAWGLGFCLGNVVKYVARAGKKRGTETLEDLEKARWYLDREIMERGGTSWKPK